MTGQERSAGAPRAGDGVLEVADLRVRYGGVPAVAGVTLRVQRGEVVALIGETGSGKSSLALAVARLLPPAAAVSGRVMVAGRDLSAMSARDLRRQRAGLLGYIAQDAMAALNPVVPVGRQVGELFRVHGQARRREARGLAVAELTRVRIAEPAQAARRYPHQLSGGMRQRVMIAMAVALAPPLIIADESTTALDVSTQAEILALIAELRASTGAGILWITHDMGVVAELADRVVVMYAGRVVEEGPVLDVFDHPAHPYTEGLLRTRRDLRSGRPGSPLFQIPGAPPVPGRQPGGCAFRPRCPRALELCAGQQPELAPTRPGQPAGSPAVRPAEADAAWPPGGHAGQQPVASASPAAGGQAGPAAGAGTGQRAACHYPGASR